MNSFDMTKRRKKAKKHKGILWSWLTFKTALFAKPSYWMHILVATFLLTASLLKKIVIIFKKCTFKLFFSKIDFEPQEVKNRQNQTQRGNQVETDLWKNPCLSLKIVDSKWGIEFLNTRKQILPWLASLKLNRDEISTDKCFKSCPEQGAPFNEMCVNR